MTKHKFKSIDGAVRRIRQLEKQVKSLNALCEAIGEERYLMARLASDTPEFDFDNPLQVIEAKNTRDRILGRTKLTRVA